MTPRLLNGASGYFDDDSLSGDFLRLLDSSVGLRGGAPESSSQASGREEVGEDMGFELTTNPTRASLGASTSGSRDPEAGAEAGPSNAGQQLDQLPETNPITEEVLQKLEEV
ncbi:hypothetical protein CYMTET_45061 [Cymbomonas tetramitiformis]|uniref:Uncharacterized protein n=1 Tax=Cymbomonas tetramitiformis TaxID=36881 RepID=A0AAE0BYZ2_9CHLO|nr:hypothetical protein CYMTET_45061 [Cymbomonas tetramitiformis]